MATIIVSIRNDSGLTRHVLESGVMQQVNITSYDFQGGSFFPTPNKTAIHLQADVQEDRDSAPAALRSILRRAVEHGMDYPDHGTNCACLDPIIRELYAEVDAAIPRPDGANVRARLDARWRISYILGVISRRI